MTMLAEKIAEAFRKAEREVPFPKRFDNAVLAPTTAWLLVDDIDRMCGLTRIPKAVKVNEYMGFKIHEDPNMPVNRMVLRQGTKVVAIVDLDREQVNDQQPNGGKDAS